MNRGDKMTTLEQACKIIKKKYIALEIGEIYDINESWLFSLYDPRNSEESLLLSCFPAIKKENGEFFLFFPPDSIEQWRNRKKIDF